jgi:hypothetical protein
MPLSGCAVATFTLMLNIGAVVYFHQHTIPGPGVRVPVNPRIFIGDCGTASRLNAGLHALINALSTLLLASSNMFMQLALAPTRAELDKCHHRQRWLDVGVPSLRNLRFLSMRNRLLWFLLACSSIPLHLLYVLLILVRPDC